MRWTTPLAPGAFGSVWRQPMLRYALVGISNCAVGFAAICIALQWLHWPATFANAAGYAIGFLWSFAWNRHWSFGIDGRAGHGMLRFAAVCGGGYLLNLGTLLALAPLLGPRSLLAQAAGMAVYTASTYLGARHWAFRRNARR